VLAVRRCSCLHWTGKLCLAPRRSLFPSQAFPPSLCQRLTHFYINSHARITTLSLCR
jgi:hypothetical protein